MLRMYCLTDSDRDTVKTLKWLNEKSIKTLRSMKEFLNTLRENKFYRDHFKERYEVALKALMRYIKASIL